MVQLEFLPLKKLLDMLCRKLHPEGVGCSSKKVEVVTEDEEEQLWGKGILNSDTPQGLLNAVLFLNGKFLGAACVAAPILFSFGLPVCNARPIYIYIYIYII